MNGMASGVLAFLATYLVHSTLLIGAAWILGRYVVPGDGWRETLWKAALLGGLVTSAAAQASPWTVRVALPELGAESGAPVPRVQGQATHPPSPVEPERLASEAGETPVALAGDGAAERDEAIRTDQAMRDQSQTQAATGGTTIEPSGVTGRAVSWSLLVLATWLAVAATLIGRFGVRRMRLGRLLRDRRMVTEADLPEMLATLRRTAGVWVPVRLTKSPAIASPMVFGRCEICVPDRFVTDLSAAEQRAALAHELGHLARRDPAWLLCALVLECVFFFQPLQRVARRGLRESAEYMADSWAVRLGGGRLSLARCLAEVASWVSTSDEPALAEMVAMAEGGSPLLSRVSRLLERDPEPEPRFAMRAAAVVALIAVAGAFAPAVGGAPDHERVGGDNDPAPSAQSDFAANVNADVDLDADAVSGDAQDYLDVTHWPGKGGSLPDGLRWAGASARDAGVGAWWVAWVTNSRVPRGSGAAGDSEPGQWSQLNERGVESLLSVTHDVPRTGGFEDAIMLVRLVADGDGARIDRLAMRTSGRSMDVRGHVYWLGRLDVAASLGWLRDRYAEVQTSRLREAAVEAIAVHDAPAAPAFLRNVIESRADRNLAAQAVEGLEWHPSDETMSLLLETAQGDGDLSVRTEAAETLGELDHPGAGGALRNLIRAGDRRVRAEALESLAERGDTALAALLLDIALNDPDAAMRQEAVELMQELPVSVAVPLLERVIAESRDERVVHEAIETLADIGSESAFAVIEALTSHEVPSIRREAMEALLDGPGEASGQTLLDIAMHDDDPDMRREAVERIAELPSQEAVELLRRVVFESGDGTAERQAAESLGDVGTIEALAVLDDIIARNPGEDASVQAVESIGQSFARELAVPRLTRIAREHPSRRVRREALDYLADLTGGS